jgi:hypothetical protein
MFICLILSFSIFLKHNSLASVFNSFIQLIDHPLFQEIPPAVYKVIADFHQKYLFFKLPDNLAKFNGLRHRINDHLKAPSAIKGMFYSFLLTFWLLFIFFTASIAAANLHPSKGKKTISSVSLCFSSSTFYKLSFSKG